MSSNKPYSGDHERLQDPIDREILAVEFDTVLKQAGILKPQDVQPYGETVWERIKENE